MNAEVKYISFKNQQWPIRVSYYAIKKFQEETKKDISEVDKDISLLEVLLWYSLIAGHTATGVPVTLKREDMEFILDESMVEFNEILMSFFPLATDGISGSVKKN